MNNRNLVLLGFVLVALSSAAAGANTFRNKRCGLEFRYPAGWHARIVDAKHEPALRCTAAVDPPHWKEMRDRDEFAVEEHSIFVKVYSAPFPDFAPKAGFFLESDGKWRIEARGKDYAILATKDTSVVVSAPGGDSDAFEIVLRSTRVTRDAP